MVDVVVGALVVDRRVLLGHRRFDKQVHPGAWDLPGGVVEAGESEWSALARELHEELGVDELPPLAHPLIRASVADALRDLRRPDRHA